MSRFIILCYCLLLYSPSHSQSYDANDNSIMLSLSPQYILVNGFRVNFEKRFEESAHSLVLSPTAYIGDVDSRSLIDPSYHQYEMSGAGVEITHKIYTAKSWDRDVNWYQSYSLIYNYFNFNYSNEDWTEFPNPPFNDLIVLAPKDQSLKVQQLGLNIFLGALVELDKNIYTDVYLGIGAKGSFANDSSTDKLAEEDLQDGFLNYNFSGALLRAGIRLGMSF